MLRRRRDFLRRSLGLLAGGAAGATTGRLATAVGAVGLLPDSRTHPPNAAAGPAGAALPGQSTAATAARASSSAGSGVIVDPPFSIPDVCIPEIARAGPAVLQCWEPDPPLADIPRSILQERPMLTIYGRSFGVAPLLGMLGEFQSFDELEAGIDPWVRSMSEVAGTQVYVALHMIYALARPCYNDDDSCLIYLDLSGVDLVNDYIQPAAERGMAVILDAQMGRRPPLHFVRHMIDQGYMAYPNVHVALDPEFATRPGQSHPGSPIGRLSADQINEAQTELATYVRDEGLSHKKVMIIHQFVDDVSDSWSMVTRKRDIQALPEVELVYDADGFGSPDAKIVKYNAITNPEAYPQLKWRGIKIFSYNRHAPRYSDAPVLTPRQLFGLDTTSGGRRMWAAPHLIVLA